MQRFNGYSRILATGAPAPSSTVTIYDLGTLNLSTIYSDDATPPTAKANPFTAGTDGFFFFYAASAEYDVNLSDGGIPTPYTWGGNMLTDVDDLPNRYEDLFIDMSNVTKGPANNPGFDVFLGALRAYAFSKTADEELFFTVPLPHDWKEGSDIIAHVHWAPKDTDTGDVVWAMEYTWANRDATFPAPTTISATADAGDGTAHKHQATVNLGTISGTGKTISSILMCRIYRDVSEDDYDNDAFLLEVGFHLQLDAIGSVDADDKT